MPVGDQYRLFPPKILVNRHGTENLKAVFVTALCSSDRSASLVSQTGQPQCSRRNAMSSLRPASEVSQITGASAAFTTATSSCGSI